MSNAYDLGLLEKYARGQLRDNAQEEPLMMIQAVNVLLRDTPMQSLHPVAGRNRFFGLNGLKPLTGGVEVAEGVFQ